VIRKAFAVVASVVGLLVLTALLPWLTGREPAYAVLRAREREREITPELIEAVRREYGLPTTPWESLQQWTTNILHGDFGTSWVTGQDAFAQAVNGFGITFALTATSMALCVFVALALVLPRIAGMRAGKWTPSVLAVLAALPSFVVAVLLLWWLAVELRMFR